MPPHIIARGETLDDVAKKNGFKFWRNLYYADENLKLRIKRSSPRDVRAGDAVEIPKKGLEPIQTLEKRGRVVHEDVPLYTQPTATTCWRACARMLFAWKHHASSAAAKFDAKIGEKYRSLDTGLAPEKWNDFYINTVGMASTAVHNENLLNYIVAAYGPVVVFDVTSTPNSGHALVLAGFDLEKGLWYFLNPAGLVEMDFSEGLEITAGNDGSSEQRSGEVGFRNAKANAKNMGRWIGMAEIGLRREVFHWMTPIQDRSPRTRKASR